MCLGATLLLGDAFGRGKIEPEPRRTWRLREDDEGRTSMSELHGLEALTQGAVLSSFTRTARLLAGIEGGHKKPIEMTSGDPKEAMPSFVVDKLVEAKTLLGTYPRIRGSDELRKAIAAWIGRRYGLAGAIDFEHEVLPVNGRSEERRGGKEGTAMGRTEHR